jgi:hypothetical protein
MNLPALPATQVLGHDAVDWQLLLLFIGLFVVNHAFESTGLAAEAVARLAGNLLLVGSIANLIVVDLARKSGIAIDWRQHAVTGSPRDHRHPDAGLGMAALGHLTAQQRPAAGDV